MRLYVTPRGRWAGTQADARDLSKEDGGWEQREVPTDKEGLLSFLNANKVDAMHGEARAMIVVPPSPSPPIPALPASMAAPITLTEIEEAIQAADGFRLGRLLDNAVSRLEELRREAGIPHR